MSLVPLGLALPEGDLPAELTRVPGHSATMLLAPAGASSARRLLWHVACHRVSAAYLPLATTARGADPDDPSLLETLEGARGLSAVVLETERAGPTLANGESWLRVRAADHAARRRALDELEAVVGRLGCVEASIVEARGGPMALLLVPTGACREIGAAACRERPGLIVSAPWPVFGFQGAAAMQ